MGHVNHRKKRALTRAAARVALVLGIAGFLRTMLDFAVKAYSSSNCFTPSAYYDSGVPMRRDAVDSDQCRLLILERDERQRIDATIAILAVIAVIGAAVRLSTASRRARRAALMVEIAVAVAIFYFVLLSTAFR
jgi:hypothetical protein